MAKSIDFNTLKKKYLSVTLQDEKKTKLLICTPTKGVLNSFFNMRDSLSEQNMSDETISELYGTVAQIMNHNKGGIKISPKLIEDLFDFEDILTFIRIYTEFISEVTSSKN